MKSKVETRLDKLEAYVVDEMEAIRKLAAKEESSKKDLFSITTYSEVCKELKEKEETCPYKQIKQIEKLYNGDWIKDWSNPNQQKFYPYFIMNTSYGRVVGFSDSYFSSSNTYGQVAFYKDRQTSDYIGKTFWNIYKQIL